MKRAAWTVGFFAVLCASQSVAAEQWWNAFSDDNLNAVVAEALADNPDINAVRARRSQAQALVFQQASGSLPQVSLAGGANWAPTENLGFGFGFDIPGSADEPKTYSSGQANLQATWNVDLFGQNGALVYAAERDAKAAKNDVAFQEVGLSAQVVVAYWDAVAANQLLALAEEQHAAQKDLLEIVELRFRATDAGALDVLQQRQQVSSTAVLVPQRRIMARISKQSLSVLMGRSPMELVAVAESVPKPPTWSQPLDVDELVRSRPDVIAASRRVQAAKARHWSAWASALPRVGVSAQTGVQFFDRGEWLTQNVWGAGTTVTVPLFSGGRTYGAIRQAKAGLREAESRYQATQLASAQQIDASVFRDREQVALIEALEQQALASRQAWELARDQMRLGLTTYFNAQLALTRMQQAEIALIQGRRDALVVRVDLYRSIGRFDSEEEGS